MDHSLNHTDYWVIGVYFALTIGLVLYLVLKERNGKEDSSDYFLGGRNLGWFVVGSSLFASNIGSEHLVGLAGAGASGDFPAAQFEIMAAFMLLLLGWLFVPLYLKTGVYTMPRFLELRYGKWAKNYLVWVSILGYILTKISVTIAAGGIIFTTILGINFWFGAILVVVLTGIYTALGGLKAVAYTDTFQMFILIGGSVALTYYALDAGGGWSTMKATLPTEYTSLWRGLQSENFPWTGIILGAPILGVWYWCTDQFIVQRVLAVKNIQEARKSTLFASYLKILPLFLFVIPGVLAYSLSTGDNPVLTFPVENGNPVYDAALPVMTASLLPHGLKGLVVAGLLAALMSSLSSVFNSCSTLITLDLYKVKFPDSTETQLVRIGRVSTGVLVLLGLAWIPLLQLLEGGLFQKIQSIQSYISPPIAAVFLVGILAKGVSERGAKNALITGAILGGLKLLSEIVKPSLSGFALQFAEMNFLHFAFVLFIFCSAVLLLSGGKPVSNSSTLNIRGVEVPRTPALLKLLILILISLIAIIWYVF